MHGRKSHDLVSKGITALVNLDHRGASGAETNTGDGAGILLQIPDRFYRAELAVDLPEPGAYATGIGFLQGDEAQVTTLKAAIGTIVASEGLEVLTWREVPTVPDALGSGALGAMPSFQQVFIAAGVFKVLRQRIAARATDGVAPKRKRRAHNIAVADVIGEAHLFV